MFKLLTNAKGYTIKSKQPLIRKHKGYFEPCIKLTPCQVK